MNDVWSLVMEMLSKDIALYSLKSGSGSSLHWKLVQRINSRHKTGGMNDFDIRAYNL